MAGESRRWSAVRHRQTRRRHGAGDRGARARASKRARMVNGRIHRADTRLQRSCARVHKLILLSTDPGGTAAELASPPILGQLTDTSGTPHEQARRLLFLLFPSDLAESIYREFGDVVAGARAKLSPELVDRQAAAMDAWHRDGAGDRLRELRAPTLIATGTEDIVIPASNALALVNAIPGAWLAQFKGAGHAFMAQYPRSLADLINEFLAL
jgi:pimeloyl-ACP methyl ester carboxylesterase